MDCKLKEGDPLSPHVIKMIGYMQALDRLGLPLLDELATDVVFSSAQLWDVHLELSYAWHG